MGIVLYHCNCMPLKKNVLKDDANIECEDKLFEYLYHSRMPCLISNHIFE